MQNILVIGSINMDMVMMCDRVPESGETLNGRDFECNLGGKGANQAIACAKLGGSVKMLGCVGQDGNGAKAIQDLKSFGVDVSCIRTVDGPTGVAMIIVCNGDNRILIDKGANGFLTPSMIDESVDVIKWADVVVLQLEIPMETVIYAAKCVKQLGKTVVLNPAPIAPLSEELIALSDWIIPNETESLSLTGCKEGTDWETVLEKILELGAKNAMITLGEKGCIYSCGKERKYGKAYPVKAVDTTAAGDTFVGAWCTALCNGNSLEKAVDFAARASAVTVTRKGAGMSIPTLDEIE
ncbi:MAG: ribokinase [Ruminococcaceae bacterium]|nr:ribokinase [Oscillospiraceae bacterium]